MTQKKSDGKRTPEKEGSKIAEIAKASPNIHLVSLNEKPQPKGEEKKPSYEDLQKRVEELERQKLKKPASIQEAINFFEEKKKKITHLDLFHRILERLNDAYAIVKPQADDQEFEKQEFVLSFSVYSSYSKGEEIFKVTNPLVITKCISFLRGEIQHKTAVLEQEIKADF